MQGLTPFLDLPFATFVAIIRLIDLAALVALAGPATVFALLLPPVAAEINAANINLPLGLASSRRSAGRHCGRSRSW